MLTVAQARDRLYRYVAAHNPFDVDFLQHLNEVCDRCLTEGKWEGAREEISLTPVDNVVTLPSQYKSLLGLSIEGMPGNIVTHYYNYIRGGRNYGDAAGVTVDMGFNDEGNRQYRIAWQCDEEPDVQALALRRHVWLEDDDDEVVPSNVGALKQGLLAVAYEGAGDPERAQFYWTQCFNILNSELRTSRGGAVHLMDYNPQGFQLPPVRNVM
jgi:hypothetical protein